DDDNSNGWVDEVAALSQAERKVIESKLKPVKLMLTKVWKVTYKIIYSTTDLLPAWIACLEELGQPIKLIPRDMCTRWNSTYDLLLFLLEHRRAYTQFTGDARNKL
ncbi:hypothetical protein BDQ17DRAFT_1179942, partial [Cyathus striatus]